MPEAIGGVLLSRDEVNYALKGFEVLLRDRQPSPQLAEFLARLRRSCVPSDVGPQNPYAAARLGAPGGDRGPFLAGDVLDSAEAAKVLGVGSPAVRDLARRGSLRAIRAGGRWLFCAADVVARAERRARN